MDLVVILVLVMVIVFWLKDVKWVTYLLGIIEIFLNIVHYIGDHLGVSELNGFINQHLPTSLFAVVGKYTTGVVYDVCAWILLVFFIFFLLYLVRYLFQR